MPIAILIKSALIALGLSHVNLRFDAEESAIHITADKAGSPWEHTVTFSEIEDYVNQIVS